MNTFSPSLSKRKNILKTISHSHSQWKGRIFLAGVLILLALGILSYTVVLLVNHRTSTFGIFIFLCAGVCLACVPFFIGLSVKNTAKFKCALPYSSYANASLLLGEDALEYVFWRVGPREPAAYSSKHAVYKDEDKFIYRINKGNINSIDIKENICKIKGNGSVQMPEWAEEDSTVKKTSKEFSFIMAFEQGDVAKIIAEWRI